MSPDVAPFRHRLRLPEGKEPGPEYLHLLVELSRPSARLRPELFQRVLESGEESLLILMEGQVFQPWSPDYSMGKLRAEWASRLLQRALEEAWREGVCWTPLVDLLDQDLERAPRGWFPEDWSRPSLHEVARGLVPWLEAQGEPAALAPLFAFGGPTLREVVARCGAVFDRPVVEWLRETPAGVALLANPALAEPLREEVLGWAWQRWSESAPHSARLLEAGARQAKGLPEGLREEMWRYSMDREVRVVHPGGVPDVLRVLLQDPRLSASRLRLLACRSEPWLLAAVYRHPNTPDEVFEALLAERKPTGWQRRGAELAFTLPGAAFPLCGERLSALLEGVSGEEPSSLLPLFSHPDVAPETVERALEKTRAWAQEARERLVELVAAGPEALRHGAMRRMMEREGTARSYATLLVSTEDPELYRIALEGMWRVRKREVYRHLRDSSPPEGVRVSPNVLAEMLTEGGSEERLLVIRQLGGLQVGRFGEEPRQPLPEPESRGTP